MRKILTALILVLLGLPACGTSDSGTGRPNTGGTGGTHSGGTGGGGTGGTSSGGTGGGTGGTSSGGTGGTTTDGSAGAAGSGGTGAVDAGGQSFTVTIVNPPQNYLIKQSDCGLPIGLVLTPMAIDPFASYQTGWTWTATSYKADGTVYAGPITIATEKTPTWVPYSTATSLLGPDKYSTTGQKIVISLHTVDALNNYGDASVTIYFQLIPC